jgi:putative NADH-flavin reductase
MRITVLGATGGTGRQLVAQAVAAGHEVTAVVRNPAGLSVRGAQVVVADVFDAAALEEVVAGRDAVISALGVRPKTREPVVAPAAEAAVKAMRAAGTARLLVVTASGHVTDGNDDFLTRRVLKPLLWQFLRANWSDFAAADRIVTASGLDWTIMRPPRLTDGGHQPYRTAIDHNLRGGNAISRADLATETLKAAADPATIGHAVVLGY